MAEAIPTSAALPTARATHDYPRAVRLSLPQQVRAAIEEQILTGALREGDQIVEYRVAREMGISQTPVREALRTLEMDGVVVTMPHRGTFVRRVTRREAHERYTLGAELEAYAIRLALPRLTPTDFAHLERIIDQMAQAGRAARLAPTPDSWRGQRLDSASVPSMADPAFARHVELNVAFHRFLVEHSGHELLLNTWLSINPLNWRFVTYTRLVNPNLEEVAERHRALLQVYRTGDTVQATAAIREHILEVAQQVLPRIPHDDAGSHGDNDDRTARMGKEKETTARSPCGSWSR